MIIDDVGDLARFVFLAQGWLPPAEVSRLREEVERLRAEASQHAENASQASLDCEEERARAEEAERALAASEARERALREAVEARRGRTISLGEFERRVVAALSGPSPEGKDGGR